VLDGLGVDTDVEVIRWPDRYADDRGRVMWERVMELLTAYQEGAGGEEGQGGHQRHIGEERWAGEVGT